MLKKNSGKKVTQNNGEKSTHSYGRDLEQT
jgi:hypothetical protein